eukprot:gene13471-19330_t
MQILCVLLVLVPIVEKVQIPCAAGARARCRESSDSPCAAAAAAACYLMACMNTYWPAPFNMSLLQAERWEALQELVSEPYNEDNAEYKDTLRRLWARSFDTPCPPSLKSSQWTDMGWQGEDPGTDIRGAGMFGLRNLLFFAEHEEATFRRLMKKTDGQRSDWEYPFAAASLNITFTLLQVLDLSKGGAPGTTLVTTSRSADPAVLDLSKGVAPGATLVTTSGSADPAVYGPRTLPGQSFLQLLETEHDAFERLHIMTFELLDRVWLERKASYMQFNEVLKAVRARVEAALVSRPGTIPELRRRLLR